MSTFDPSLANLSANLSTEAVREKSATPGMTEFAPVVVQLPAELTGGVALQVLFRAPDQVDVRRADGAVWSPVQLHGGRVEVRPR